MSLALSAALEAVKFQAEPVLFEAVTRSVKAIRAENAYTATAPSVKALNDLIVRHTNLNLLVSVDSSEDINASAFLPDLSRSHPIITNVRRQRGNNRAALAILKQRDSKVLNGRVDLQKGKVYGDLASVESVIEVTTGLLDYTAITHEEVAALILHEVGHILTYCEYVHRSVTSNYALLAVAEEVVGASEEKRIELIDATSKRFNIESDYLEPLKTSQSKEVAYSVLITRHIQKTRSELGANVYDERGCEHLADQYATRMGGGAALVTGLAKMYRRHPSRYSTSRYIAFEGMKITLVALSTLALSPFLLVAMTMAYDPTQRIYDEPEARFRRIRNELVGGMKDRSLSDDRRAQLKKDLEMIDAAMSEYKDRRSFYEYLYTTFLPSARNQNKQIEHQQELESLANNELFAKAMNFTLI